MGLLGLPYMFTSLLTGMLPIVGVIFLILFLRQRKGQEKTMPALDLIDGRKLDSMVSQQIDAALKPFLIAEGYSNDEINTILTPNSLGGPKFKR